ncbi:uncharacterized protein LOC113324544 [Papaver somniferum]|uniref:uncharacterized protein LOC113324544 n=1 Tax=Papaver somniferum TaxID=3469 RepID=UPI000E6F4911|nr:uncharacterized protein LOC113324544 [Papaver somniferum]
MLATKTALLFSPLHHRVTLYFAFSSSLQLNKCRKFRRPIIKATRTESKGALLGSRAPDFRLVVPLTRKTWEFDDFESHHSLLKGLAVFVMSSNSVVRHQQDGPEFIAEETKLFKYPFRYLYDESQGVARAFRVVYKSEFLLYKKDCRKPFELVYNGQFDDSRPSNNMRVTGRDLSMAIGSVLILQPLSFVQKRSVGLVRCMIKWHPEKSM